MTQLLAGLDIETTGFLAPDHRIVEVYIGLWANRKRVFEYHTYIDPERAMPIEAQRVHGISGTDLIGQPKWTAVAPDVLKILSRVHGFVWQNGDAFDGPFIDQELKRVGLPGIPNRPSMDTMLNGTWATHDGKKPTLGELCFACGVPYDRSLAHGANYDTEVMMNALFAGQDMGLFSFAPAETSVAA